MEYLLPSLLQRSEVKKPDVIWSPAQRVVRELAGAGALAVAAVAAVKHPVELDQNAALVATASAAVAARAFLASRVKSTLASTAALALVTSLASEADEEIWRDALPQSTILELGLNRLTWLYWVRDLSVRLQDGMVSWEERAVCLEYVSKLLSGRVLSFRQRRLTPLAYRQDTGKDKLIRVALFTGRLASEVAPFISSWQAALTILGTTTTALVQHGPVALGMTLLSDRVRDALQDLATSLHLMKQESELPVKQLAVGLYYLLAYCRGRRGNNPLAIFEEHQVAPGNGVVSDTIPSDILEQVCHYAPLASFAYHEEPAEAQRLAALRGYQLVVREAYNPGKYPAFLLLVREGAEVVLVLRGTKEIGDVMLDVSQRSVPMTDGTGNTFWVHRGMLRGATWIWLMLAPVLVLYRNWGYRVTVVGHSLGGGVGVLLSTLLRPALPNIRCFTFGCPPVSCKVHAEYCKPFVINTVLGDDMVSRFHQYAIRGILNIISDPHFQNRTTLDLDQDIRGITKRLMNLWAPRVRMDPTHWDMGESLRLVHDRAVLKKPIEKIIPGSANVVPCPSCPATCVVHPQGWYNTCPSCNTLVRASETRPLGDPLPLRLLFACARKKGSLKHVQSLWDVTAAEAQTKLVVHMITDTELRANLTAPWSSRSATVRRMAMDTTVGELREWAASALEARWARVWAFAQRNDGACRPCVQLTDDSAPLVPLHLRPAQPTPRPLDLAVYIQPLNAVEHSPRQDLLLLQFAPPSAPPQLCACLAVDFTTTPLEVVVPVIAAQSAVTELSRMEVWEQISAHKPRLIPRGKWKDHLYELGLRSGDVLVGNEVFEWHYAAGSAGRASPSPKQKQDERDDDFWLAGKILHVYKCQGVLRGSVLEAWAPPLARIEVSEYMADDHRMGYMCDALRSLRELERNGGPPPPCDSWVPFDAADKCMSCSNPFIWRTTGSGSAQEFRSRHHCYNCGRVVCSSCRSHTAPLPSKGMVLPQPVCDICYWTL